jgi:hypothetical protein
MSWDNVRQKQFREALQDVYRSYSALQIFVRDAIDRNLAEIVEQSGLMDAAFKLLDWARRRARSIGCMRRFVLKIISIRLRSAVPQIHLLTT